MRLKLASIFLVFLLFALTVPADALAQQGNCEGGRSLIRRGKNGIRVGDRAITFLDGDGIVNYEYRHRWMEGPAGAATVIGIGAGAGAVTGGVVKGKKGAVYGALIGAGAATGLWLYKNRTTRRRIF
jgi:hypothetical protein